MKDAGKTTKPAQANAGVFISLPASFPIQWTGLIHGRAMDLGLSAFVYHGIPQSPFQQTNNVEYEARSDLFSAKLVFAALVIKGAVEYDGVWVIKHIPKLKEKGIEFNLAFVGEGVADFDNGQITNNILAVAEISSFPAPEEWLTFCTDEMKNYAARFYPNRT